MGPRQAAAAQHAVRARGVHVAQPGVAGRHFVAALAAAEVHSAVVVAKLGKAKVRLAPTPNWRAASLRLDQPELLVVGVAADDQIGEIDHGLRNVLVFKIHGGEPLPAVADHHGHERNRIKT